jgi:hypothetical protein
MAEILIIAAALAGLLVIVLLAVVRRPSHRDDSDRFTNARRITTSWAADAGTDLAHPAPGQPGTVDTSPRGRLTSAPKPKPEPAADSGSDFGPDSGPTGEVVNLRPQPNERPQRRQGRA